MKRLALAATAALLRDPVAQLAEGDHADEDAAGAEHHEHDLPPLLGRSLDGQ